MPSALQQLTEAGRSWRSISAFVVLVTAAFFVLIHIYAGVFGSPDSLFFRSLHVNCALILVFLTKPLSRYFWLRWLDMLLIVAAVWVQIYFILELETWNLRTIFFRPIDYFTSVLFIVLILEATRRTVGWILVVIAIVFLCHALWADYFPGMFYGPPSSLKNLLQSVFLDSNGIFGVAVAVMANFVVLFILFGTLLNLSGGGAFFTRLAFALFGHRTGGPAKAAVMSSAMMGSLSGSAIGNVLTTGVFTIPLMIRLGYQRAFAGGVEAAASNGGIIMPPVMGAVAFIMAEFLGRPYLDIVLAAIIPALLYFLVIFITVHTEARRLGLPTIGRSKLPAAWLIFRREGYLLLPVVLIIAALIAGYSIVFVAVLVTAATFIIALLQPRRRIQPVDIVRTIEETARATVGLSVTAAAAGIILGAIFAVGLSFQVAHAAAEAAAGHLWLLLLLTAVMALIMGMGMTAPAIYLTLVATVIPILIAAGIPAMAVHFFAFYYGIISNITPPVALTAYAAAPIAGAHPLTVGYQASKLGIACFILPVLFIYEPGLLLEDSAWMIIKVTVSSALGLVALAVAATGYAFAPMPLWQRLAALLIGFLAIVPELWTDLAGAILAVLVFASNWSARHRNLQQGRSDQPEDLTDQPAAFADSEQILTEIFQAEPAQHYRDRSRSILWYGWGLVTLVAVAMAWQGENYLHARDPIAWMLLNLGLAAGLVVGLSFLYRRETNAHSDDFCQR